MRCQKSSNCKQVSNAGTFGRCMKNDRISNALWICTLLIVFVLTACATGSGDSDLSSVDDLSDEQAVASADAGNSENPTASNDSSGNLEDEFKDDPGQQGSNKALDEAPKDNLQQAQETQNPSDESLLLEDEKKDLPPNQEQVANPPPAEPPPVEQPVSEPVPVPEATVAATTPQKAVEITGLNYKANDSGGTVIIEATGPVTYTTRANPDLHQFVVEIPNSKLPAKLKRTLNTKDFKGAIGAIDAYQSKGSLTSRIVIQLREGAAEPFVQAEGNSLLIVSTDPKAGDFAATGSSLPSNTAAGEETVSAEPVADADLNINLNDSRILTSQSLEDFLSGNSKYYGKRISVEFNRTDLRQAIRFFMEETGINMIIDKEVTGEITMKLRQVPWDQAFVTMLRMGDLIYQRQGSILRIATVKKLQTEEKDAHELIEAKRLTQPLFVRNYFVNFATVPDTAKSIKEMLKEGGKDSPTTKIVEDVRNGKLIVQDTEANLNLIEKLVKNLDIPIKQVLIEAKIVEATEKFTRQIGVTWNFHDGTQALGNQSLSLNRLGAGKLPEGADFNFDFRFGSLPLLGDLDASLALAEIDQTVKVVSSPRILTLTGIAASVNVTENLTSKSTSVATATPGAPPVDTYKEVAIPTTLNVTPTVTPDNFVTMKIGITRTVGTANPGGTVSTGTRTVDTNILVRDGQTATIGGLYQTDSSEGMTGVPVLKDIPYLGALFRAKNEIKSKTELLIFLTPRVVNQDFQSTQAKEGETL